MGKNVTSVAGRYLPICGQPAQRPVRDRSNIEANGKANALIMLVSRKFQSKVMALRGIEPILTP